MMTSLWQKGKGFVGWGGGGILEEKKGGKKGKTDEWRRSENAIHGKLMSRGFIYKQPMRTTHTQPWMNENYKIPCPFAKSDQGYMNNSVTFENGKKVSSRN